MSNIETGRGGGGGCILVITYWIHVLFLQIVSERLKYFVQDCLRTECGSGTKNCWQFYNAMRILQFRVLKESNIANFRIF